MQKFIPIIIAVVVAGGGGFYGGMKYGQSKNAGLANAGQGLAGGGSQNFRNLSPEERQQRLSELGAGGGFGARRGGIGGSNFATAGEIISTDDRSITLKLRDGGSRVVFLSGTTRITKPAEGSRNDLAVGSEISVSGTPNKDGSVTADAIQIRPSATAQSQGNTPGR